MGAHVRGDQQPRILQQRVIRIRRLLGKDIQGRAPQLPALQRLAQRPSSISSPRAVLTSRAQPVGPNSLRPGLWVQGLESDDLIAFRHQAADAGMLLELSQQRQAEFFSTVLHYSSPRNTVWKNREAR